MMKVNPFQTAIQFQGTRSIGNTGTGRTMTQGAQADSFVRQSEPQHPINRANTVRFGVSGVDPDLDRFQRILRDKAREDLKKFINPDKMNITRGGKVVQLPKPRIDQPHFTRGTPQDGEGGVGSGDGDEGDQVGQVGQDGQPQPGDGDGDEPGEGEAGEDPGQHELEKWGPQITRSEIARMIMKDLVLPNMQPKGSDNVKQTDVKWTSVSKVGNKFLVRKTLNNAMQRTAVEKGKDAKPGDVAVTKDDVRYRSYELEEKPQANAVIFYLRDYSGSMGPEQSEMARTTSFYLSTVIQHQFGEVNAELRGETFTDDDFGDGVEEVFILHDTEAEEVSEREFYESGGGGGTKISSAFEKVEKLIKEKYPPNDWNIYVYHYSDGDNWGHDDQKSIESIERLLPQVNEVGYIQTTSAWGSGKFKDSLKDHFGDTHNKVRVAKINDNQPEEYARVIKKMLSEKNEGDDE